MINLINCVMDGLILLLVVIIGTYCYKIFKNHNKYWIFVIALFGYSFILRLFIFMNDLGLKSIISTPDVATLMFVFWMGITVIFAKIYYDMKKLVKK